MNTINHEIYRSQPRKNAISARNVLAGLVVVIFLGALIGFLVISPDTSRVEQGTYASK